MKFSLRRSSSRALLAGFVLLLSVTEVSIGQSKERVSKPGQLQTDPKPEAKPAPATAMAPVSAKTPAAGGGPMQEQLQTPRPAAAGKKQPSITTGQAALQQGKGEQKAARTAAKPETAHLHLVLELTEGGEVKVVRATEVPGPAIALDVPTGDFVYEVLSGDQTVQVQGVPDPFEMRSFAPLDAPQQGHHFERAKTATIVVRVPNMRLSSPLLGKLAIRVYKLKPGVSIEKMDLPTLRNLKERNNIELRFHLAPQQLAPQIRERAVKPLAQ
ncbi:MAG TPA: hypothetical protein VF532_21550 [Candidatus Angelobacter sp.]